MAAIFKRGWSWLCSLSMQFYLSWTFHTSSVPWLWGCCPQPPPPLAPNTFLQPCLGAAGLLG